MHNGATLVVRFAHGIEECESADLEVVAAPHEAVDRDEWDIPLEVVNRLQAEAILSVNDTWGVFSKSRVELLPHQLWVCRQAAAVSGDREACARAHAGVIGGAMAISSPHDVRHSTRKL